MEGVLVSGDDGYATADSGMSDKGAKEEVGFSGKDKSNILLNQTIGDGVKKKAVERGDVGVCDDENVKPMDGNVRLLLAYEGSRKENEDSSRQTMQRFYKVIGDVEYHVRVLLDNASEETSVSFYDVKKDEVVVDTVVKRQWLESLSKEVRQSLLKTSPWFSDNAEILFKGTISSPKPPALSLSTPVKPSRVPPPVPSPEEVEDARLIEEIMSYNTPVKFSRDPPKTPPPPPTSAKEIVLEKQARVYEEKLSERDARISELEELASSMGVQRLESQLDERCKTISELTSSQGDLQAQLDEKSATIAALEERIKLERVQLDDKATLEQEQMKQLEGELKSMQEMVVQVEQDTKTLVSKKQAELTELEAKLEEQTSRVLTLEKQLENGDMTKESKEEHEGIVAQLKIKLMDVETERDQLSQTVLERDQELEQVVVETEQICQRLNLQHESERQTSKQELDQAQKACKLFEGHWHQARKQVEEVHKELTEETQAKEKLTADLEVAHTETKRLENELKEMEHQLELMTESKKKHKEYGATMKVKLVDLQNTCSIKFDELENEKVGLEKALADQTKLIKSLENDLQAAKESVTTASSEASSMQHEIVRLGHELDEAVRSLEETEQVSQKVREEASKLALERDALVTEKSKLIDEFETKLLRESEEHSKQVTELKVQIFDANALTKELQGYVSELMDSEVCSKCKSNISS